MFQAYIAFALLVVFFAMTIVTTCLVIRLVKTGWFYHLVCCGRNSGVRIVLNSRANASVEESLKEWSGRVGQSPVFPMQENPGYSSWINEIKAKKGTPHGTQTL